MLISEIALRIYVASRGWSANCYATGTAFFVPHSTAGHTLRPNLRLKSTTYDVSVNGFGLRGPKITQTKPPGTIRIAVLGGSSVFGYLVPEGQDSCRVLESKLRQKDFAVEVLNAGVPGFTMHQSRERFVSEIAPLEPDYAVLYLGWNDIPMLLSDAPEKLDRSPPAPAWYKRLAGESTLYGFLRFRLFPAVSPKFAPPPSQDTKITAAGAAAFKSDLAELIDCLRQHGATPVLSTQVMAASEGCNQLDEYLGINEEQVAANREIGMWISGQIRTAAEAEELTLVDCAANVDCSKSTLGDAIHLTRIGHEAVAEMWATSFVELLSSATTDASLASEATAESAEASQ